MKAAAIGREGTQYLVLSTLLLAVGAMRASGDERSPAFLGRTAVEWQARLQSHSPHQRAEAAWAIGQLMDQNSADFAEIGACAELITMVADKDVTVRYWGQRGIQRLVLSEIKLADRPAMRQALRTALADSAPAPRIVAAESLVLLEQADAAFVVLVEAMSHPQDAVRIQAVAALEKLGEAARPAEATLRAATSDSSEYVKRIATRAQQKLGASAK